MKKSIAFLVLIFSISIFSLPSLSANIQSQNKALARRVFDEILNQGKFEVADQIYAKDFVNHGRTRDASLKEDQDAARGWRLAFPDLKMTVLQEIAEGDLFTVLWTATGTNTGEGNGLPATGKSGRIRGITIWGIVNGKITEEWSEFRSAQHHAATRARTGTRKVAPGLQATKPLQLSCNPAAGSDVQLSMRHVEDNCCAALIF